MDGLRVLEHLKAHPQTRHIPVHVLSGLDRKLEGLSRGAVAYVEKPVSKDRLDETFVQIEGFLHRKASKLLIVEDDERERQSMVELIGTEGVTTTAVGTIEEALKTMQAERFDCVVLDLSLQGGSGFDLLEKMSRKAELKAVPVIVYTGRDLTQAEETRLKKYARSIIMKDARSPERLLAETTLFLHRVESELSPPKRKMLHEAAGAEAVFKDRKVLIVDDDVRNIYALATVLEDAGMNVVFAENGREGIEVLRATPGIGIVLMDVMMPEMDGYETMRRVREMPELSRASHPRAHREGDEGRPREVPRRRRERLRHQARRPRPAALAHAGLALFERELSRDPGHHDHQAQRLVCPRRAAGARSGRRPHDGAGALACRRRLCGRQRARTHRDRAAARGDLPALRS